MVKTMLAEDNVVFEVEDSEATVAMLAGKQ